MPPKAVRYESLRIGTVRAPATRLTEVKNPFTGGSAGAVPRASVDDVRRALEVARAFKSPLSRYDRYQICYRAAELIRARTTEISDLITAESGLSKKDSIYEVGRACDVFLFAGNAALQDDGQIFSCDLTAHGKRRRVYTMREPLQGVITAEEVIDIERERHRPV